MALGFVLHQKLLSAKFISFSQNDPLDLFLEVIKHPELSVGDAGHLAPVSLGVVVEVPGVAIVAHLGHDRRLQLLVVDLLPINILEPSAK